MRKERRSIMISPEVHCALKMYCKNKGLIIEELVNRIIGDFILKNDKA